MSTKRLDAEVGALKSDVDGICDMIDKSEYVPECVALRIAMLNLQVQVELLKQMTELLRRKNPQT